MRLPTAREALPVTTSLARIRVVVVSTHPDYLAGLKRVIGAHGELELTAAADSEGYGVSLVRDTSSEIVILDTTTAARDGLRLLQYASPDGSGPRFLFLSIEDDHRYATRAFTAGAHGYLLKQTANYHLLDAIRALAAGLRFLDPGIDRNSA